MEASSNSQIINLAETRLKRFSLSEKLGKTVPLPPSQDPFPQDPSPQDLSLSTDAHFDWQFYIKYYEDLGDLSYEAACEHWMIFGKLEGRFSNQAALEKYCALKKIDLPEDFSAEQYLALNPDLNQRFAGNPYKYYQAIEHYLEHGKQENRSYKKEFEWQFYSKYYEDLQNIQSFEEAYEHWLTFGQKEGRYCSEQELNSAIKEIKSKLPEDFDYQIYLQLNFDLEARFAESLYQEAKAIEHFLKYGAEEKRPYAIDRMMQEQLSQTITQIQNKLEIKPPYKISIKISAPNLREGCKWGDFHYANSLKQAFERQGHSCRIDCQDAWYLSTALEDDIVIALRGRHRYQIKEHQINFLWLISHPDRATDEELNAYDQVFVASYEYAQKLSKRLKTKVSCMYQCTDANLFNSIQEPDAPYSEVLFVGSSRNIYRPIVRDAIDLDINITIYGPLWEQFVPQALIKGEYILNNQLCHYYSNCAVLLNDHWATMCQEGFLSNRLFDASSCGAFIITDAVLGLERVFSNCIETYNDPQELREKILYYIQNESLRLQKAEQARQIVLSHHTFDHRVEEFLEAFSQLRRLHQIRCQKLNRIIHSQSSSICPPISALEPSQTLKESQQEAVMSQLRFFHSNVSSLEYGIRNYELNETSIFYRLIWSISRQSPKYRDFVKKFVASEMKLLDSLSGLTIRDKEIPPVSIIMPTFNRAYVIADSIQSVLEQTYKNWNLFICDDGSTDNTKAVVEQFQDSRIHYFQLPKANGSTARNFGLKYSNGEYVAYLDSDNIWHPQHLSICIQNLETKQYAMSCYTGYIDTETIQNQIELKDLTCYSFDYYKLLNRNFIDLNSFVHRRCLFDWLGGFDENLPRLQDWDLVLKYAYLFDPMVIENHTVFYRRNIAWNQVTKKFSNVDVRSIVQNKAFHFIEQQTDVLQIQQSPQPKISLLCSTQDQEEWLKAFAMAESLVETLNVQLVIVSPRNFHQAAQNHSNLTMHWIDVPSVDHLPLTDILQEGQYQRHLNQIMQVLTNTTIVLFSNDYFCLAAAFLAHHLYGQPIAIQRQQHQTFLKEVERLVTAEYTCTNPQSVIRGSSFNLQNFLSSIQRSQFTFYAEISSEQEQFTSVILGPTVSSSLSQVAHFSKAGLRNKLGFDRKDFIVACWEQEISYALNVFEKIQTRLNNKRCKIIVLRRLKYETQVQNVDLEIETVNHIKVVLLKNEHQAVAALKEIDACILWGAIDYKNSSNLPLAFIYSLICGCIPIMDALPEYLELDRLNYCKTIPSGNIDQLIDCLNALHHDPQKVEKLKRNAQRLYALKFSQKIVREKMKYLVFDRCQFV